MMGSFLGPPRQHVTWAPKTGRVKRASAMDTRTTDICATRTRSEDPSVGNYATMLIKSTTHAAMPTWQQPCEKMISWVLLFGVFLLLPSCRLTGTPKSQHVYCSFPLWGMVPGTPFLVFMVICEGVVSIRLSPCGVCAKPGVLWAARPGCPTAPSRRSACSPALPENLRLGASKLGVPIQILKFTHPS